MRAYGNLLEKKIHLVLKRLRSQRAKSIGHCRCSNEIKQLKDFISKGESNLHHIDALKKELKGLKDLVSKGAYDAEIDRLHIASIKKELKELKDLFSKGAYDAEVNRLHIASIKKELKELKDVFTKGSYGAETNPYHIAIRNIEENMARYQARDQLWKMAKTVLKEFLLLATVGVVGDRMINRYTEQTVANKGSKITEELIMDLAMNGKAVTDRIMMTFVEDVKAAVQGVKAETPAGTIGPTGTTGPAGTTGTGAAETPGKGSSTTAAK